MREEKSLDFSHEEKVEERSKKTNFLRGSRRIHLSLSSSSSKVEKDGEVKKTVEIWQKDSPSF